MESSQIDAFSLYLVSGVDRVSYLSGLSSGLHLAVTSTFAEYRALTSIFKTLQKTRKAQTKRCMLRSMTKISRLAHNALTLTPTHVLYGLCQRLTLQSVLDAVAAGRNTRDEMRTRGEPNTGGRNPGTPTDIYHLPLQRTAPALHPPPMTTCNLLSSSQLNSAICSP